MAVTVTVICDVFCEADPKEHGEVKGVCIDAIKCVPYQIPVEYVAILKLLNPVGLVQTCEFVTEIKATRIAALKIIEIILNFNKILKSTVKINSDLYRKFELIKYFKTFCFRDDNVKFEN